MNSFFDNQNVTKQAKGIDIRTSGNNKDITKNKNYNKNKTYNWVTRALPVPMTLLLMMNVINN